MTVSVDFENQVLLNYPVIESDDSSLSSSALNNNKKSSVSLYHEMMEWTQKGIVQFPRLPLFSPSVSLQSENAALQGLKGSQLASVQKFTAPSVLEHITFEKFLKVFQNSLDDTLSYLKSLPSDSQGYVIIVDEVEKSNSWMVSLALSRLAELPPIDVVFREDAYKSLSHRNVRHVVLFDDASYSGKQIYSTLSTDLFEPIQKCQNICEVHLVIPFMTQRAKDKISSIAKQMEDIRFYCASHQLIPTIEQLVNSQTGIKDSDLKEFIVFLAEKFKLSETDTPQLTLTYFDHKIADKLSTPDAFIKSLVGNVVPPYKREFDEVLNELASSMDDGLRFETLGASGGDLAEQCVIIEKKGVCQLFTKLDCEKLIVQRGNVQTALLPFEMFELQVGDIIYSGTVKVCFDGKTINISK